MRSTDRSAPHERDESTVELIIGFDGAQVIVRTNVAEVKTHLRVHYRHMLTEGLPEDAGLLSLFARDGWYSFEGKTFDSLRLNILDPLLPLLQDEIRLHFMRYRPDLLWLHGGAVERDGRATLILAASGGGKSTLTTLLCERGWSYFSDDVVPISMDADRVIPYPVTPSRRIPGEGQWTQEDLGVADRELVPMRADEIAIASTSITSLIFPEYRRGAAAHPIRLTPAFAALQIVRNATNFYDHRGAGVMRAARLAERTPGYRLIYDSAHVAVDILRGLA